MAGVAQYVGQTLSTIFTHKEKRIAKMFAHFSRYYTKLKAADVALCVCILQNDTFALGYGKDLAN